MIRLNIFVAKIRTTLTLKTENLVGWRYVEETFIKQIILRHCMKRCYILSFVVLMLVLVSCTRAKPLQEDALSEARLRVASWDCETGSGGGPSRDGCYFDKAVILEDKTFCEKVLDSGREECLVAMKDCELLLTTTEKDQCYDQKMHARINPISSFALGTEYLSMYCEKINDAITKDSCWIVIASIFGDPVLCERLSGSPNLPYVGPLTKSTCYVAIAQSNYPSFDVCDKIIPGEGDLDWCWLNVMRTKVGCVDSNFPTELNGYSTTCNLNNGDQRVNQVEVKALASSDEKLCSSIPEKFARMGCFALVSVQKKNPEICNQIEAAAQKRECLNFVSLAKKDANVCELQQSTQDKDSCDDTYGRTHFDSQNSR